MKHVLTLLLCLCSHYALQAQIKPGLYRPTPSKKLNLNYSAPQTYTIHNIRIEGNNFLDAEILLSIAELAVGDEITLPSTKTKEVIKRIWKQNLVSDVTIEALLLSKTTLELVIRIKERPRLAAFIFEDISKSKRKELEEAIILKKGRIITDLLLKETENAVRNYYAKKGYLNANIQITQQAHPSLQTHANILIKVDKKKRSTIKHIGIHGQNTFTQSRLVRKLKGMRDRLRMTLHQGLTRGLLYALLTPRQSLRQYRQPIPPHQQWITIRKLFSPTSLS